MAEHSHAGETPTNFQRFLRLVTLTCASRPWLTLALCCGVAAASTWLTQTRLQFKTSRADLIDPRTDYHQRWLSYMREFGDVSEDMVVVVEADEQSAIERALDDLGQTLEADSKHFRNALYKVDLSRLRSKGLQYAGPDELQFLIGQLDEFSVLLRDFRKLNLYRMIRELRFQLKAALDQPPDIAEIAAAPLVRQIHLLSSSLRQYSDRAPRYLSPWQTAMPGDMAQLETQFADRYLINSKGTMGFVKVQAAKSASDFSGSAPAIDRLREAMRSVQSRHPKVSLGLTGIPVLESDEMRDSQSSMFQASILSFVGVTLLLIWGLRGIRYPLLSTITMAIGMAWSFGFTALTIGHLNILSVSFAAMLIGIGVDFSIVILERYIELRHEGYNLLDALGESAVSVGPGTITAAVTTAAGFFTAVLTDFTGVAELGIIAGGGILLFVVAAFVVQPALIAIADRRMRPSLIPNPLEANGYRRLLARHPVLIGMATTAAIAFFAVRAPDVKYDYNLLNLQAQGLDAVEVQHRIFQQSDSSLLFAVSLADSAEQARELKKKFLALPTVHHVEEIASVLPAHAQEETQLYVQAVHSLLERLPEASAASKGVDPSQIGAELEKLESLLERADGSLAESALTEIGRFLDRLDGLDDATQVKLLRDYQSRLTGELLQRFQGLAAVSHPEPVCIEDLEAPLVRRFLSARGKWLLQVYPKKQIWDLEPLEAFITEIRSIDPEATGTPLQTYEASRSIKRSYERAGVYALFAAFGILMLDFRSVRLALLALLPPVVGTALLFGVMGFFHIQLNPANMIVLPLIMGIGVDGGVHVVHDSLHQRGRYQIGSTAFSAILVNTLTTMVGFGSMMIANHRGLYSLGLVLTLGVGACLLVSLILLPAVLAVLARGRAEVAELEHQADENHPFALHSSETAPHFLSHETPVAASTGR